MDMRKPREIHVSICNRVAHVTAGSHQPLLVHDAGSLKDNDIRGAQTHIPRSVARQPAVGVIIVLAGETISSSAGTDINKSGGRQPAVGCKPHLQQQCDEFPRFEFACGGYSTGGLRPPLLVLLQRPFAGKNGDFCGAQTHIPRSGARQPAVGVSIVLATGNDFVISGYGHQQERRASARRGLLTPVVEPFGCTAAVVC
jgi:hypothetical protein